MLKLKIAPYSGDKPLVKCKRESGTSLAEQLSHVSYQCSSARKNKPVTKKSLFIPLGGGGSIRETLLEMTDLLPFALKTMRSLHPFLGNSFFSNPLGSGFLFNLLMLLVTPLALGRLIEENAAFFTKARNMIPLPPPPAEFKS